jgi:hypothetical protein
MCETMSLVIREEHCVKLLLSYYGKNIMCETTSLILWEELYVWNYVSHTKGRTLAEGVPEESAEKDILIYEERTKSRIEKTEDIRGLYPSSNTIRFIK